MLRRDDIHPNAPAGGGGPGGFRSAGPLGTNPSLDKWMRPGPLGTELEFEIIVHPRVPDTTAHYDVQRGDSLWSIASRKLGDGSYANDLATLNWISPHTKLRIGQRLIVPDYTRYDLTVTYMLSEMLKNASGPDAKAVSDAITRSKQAQKASMQAIEDMKKTEWYELFRRYSDQNTFDSMVQQSGIAMAEAKIRWLLLVQKNGRWDHKPILSKMYEAMPIPPRPFGSLDRWLHFPIRGGVFHEYFYDIWSNIHYGYVGTKCGFSEQMLQDGAASGLPFAGDNDEGDVISVRIGIELWRNCGLKLTADHIRRAILAHTEDYIAARKREIDSGKKPEEASNVVIADNDYK